MGDDVQSLADWIEPNVSRLKSVLTEKAFVTFLTGRDYLEKVYQERREDPHGLLHTLYSDCLFIQYLPSELHAYVKERLTYEAPSNEAVARIEERDLALLPFLILFRAQLQPIDMRRRLDELTSMPRVALGRPDDPGTLGVRERHEGVAQLAVEAVLEGDAMRARLESDPHFALLAIDAVYYPVRRWKHGDAKLDTSSRAFSRYLMERLARSAEDVSTTNGEVPESDLRLLWAAMLAVVKRFQSPADLRGELVDANGVPASWLVERCRAKHDPSDAYARKAASALVAGLLPDIATGGLVDEADEPDTYYWTLDPYGRQLAAPQTRDQILAVIADAGPLLRAHDEMRTVGFGLDVLQDECSLFQAGATWVGFERALDRLTGAIAAGSIYPAMSEDQRLVDAYVDAVTNALPTIDRAVSLASALRGTETLRRALAEVGRALNLSVRTPLKRREIIEACFGEMQRALSVGDGNLPPPSVTTAEQLGPRFLRVEPAVEIAPGVLDKAFWSSWERRLREREGGRTSEGPASWADVAWAVRHPQRPVLRPAFEQDTASAWMEVALSALLAAPASDGVVYPRWAAAPAFHAVGLAAFARVASRGSSESSYDAGTSTARAKRVAIVIVPRASKAWSWPVSNARATFVIAAEDVGKWVSALKQLWELDAEACSGVLQSPALLVEPTRDPSRDIGTDPASYYLELAQPEWASVRQAPRAWLLEQDVKPASARQPQNFPKILIGAQLDEALEALFPPRGASVL